MPSTTEINDALKVLNLQPYGSYTQRNFDVAYRKLAKQVHPDKGGTHKQFLALNEAYQIALNSINALPRTNVSQPVREALARLYTIISDVGKKLNMDGLPNNRNREMRGIFFVIQYSLRPDRLNLNQEPQTLIKSLREKAYNLNFEIDNLHYDGITPATSAKIFAALWTTTLSIVVLSFALSPENRLKLGPAACCGLIATPPVGGLLSGTFGFFTATSAAKEHSELKKEMKKIVTAINELADAVMQNQEEEEVEHTDFKFD